MKRTDSYFGKLSDPYHFGATMLRLAFAFLFILVAVKKLRMGYGGFAESLVSGDTLMAKEIPGIILYIYGYIIPALELLVGILLLVNRYVKTSYMLVALIYISFVFGQMYNGNTSKIGTEYFPSFLVLLAAYFCEDKLKKDK